MKHITTTSRIAPANNAQEIWRQKLVVVYCRVAVGLFGFPDILGLCGNLGNNWND